MVLEIHTRAILLVSKLFFFFSPSFSSSKWANTWIQYSFLFLFWRKDNFGVNLYKPSV